MYLLEKVDDYILDTFQQFTEYKQVTTDKNCYYFAYEASRFETWFAYFIPGLLATVIAVTTEDWFFLLITLQMSVYYFSRRSHRIVTKRVSKQVKKIPEPPRRARITGLIFCVIAIMFPVLCVVFAPGDALFFYLAVSAMAGFYMTTIKNYFLSCSPLPPETLEFRRNSSRSKKRTSVFRPQTT